MDQFKLIKRLYYFLKNAITHLHVKILSLVVIGLAIGVLEGVGISIILPLLQNLLNPASQFDGTLSMGDFNFSIQFLENFDAKGQLILFSGVILITKFFQSSLNVIRLLSTEKIALHLANFWRENLFHKILKSRISNTNSYKSGFLQNLLIVEAGNLRFLVRNYINVIITSILAVTYLGFLIILSWQLTIIISVCLVVFFLPIYRILKYIMSTSVSRATVRSNFGATIIESLNALRLIHFFESFKVELKKFKKALNELYKKEYSMIKRNGFIQPINQIISIVLVLGIILYAAFFHSQQGDNLWIIIYIFMLTRFLPIFQSMNQYISAIGSVIGSVEIIDNYIRKFDANIVNDGQLPFADKKINEIEIENVSFRYNTNSQLVFSDIDLKIESGTMVAFVGPSGSGKSTLLNLLLRLETPNSGLIKYNDKIIADYKLSSWRYHFGFVEQNPILFNETIRENIMYGCDEKDDHKMIKAAKLVGAHDFISDFEKGYSTIAGNSGNNLSGGQKQRIAIARALYRNPEIVIFDEATSAIDSESEQIINDTISELNKQGKTIIIIAHRLSSIRKVDIIHFIDEGKIVGSGTIDELQKTNDKFRKYIDYQTL